MATKETIARPEKKTNNKPSHRFISGKIKMSLVSEYVRRTAGGAYFKKQDEQEIYLIDLLIQNRTVLQKKV